MTAFLFSFLAAAGAWAYCLRDDVPAWPGGLVAEYDRRKAQGFPQTRSYRFPDDLSAAESAFAAFVTFNAVGVGCSLSPDHWPDYDGREFAKDPILFAGRTADEVLQELNHRSGLAWDATMRWESRNGRRSGNQITPAPHVRATPPNAPATPRPTSLSYPPPATQILRTGLVREILRAVGITPPLPSAASTEDSEWLRRRLVKAWEAGVDRNVAGGPSVSHDPYDDGDQPLTIVQYIGRTMDDHFFSVTISGDPRQQAAVADELRRLIIFEIVADVAVAGVGGGIGGVAVALIGSAGVGLVRRVHRRPGQCPGCRYDLRGSADSDRCPECGEPISSKVREEIPEVSPPPNGRV